MDSILRDEVRIVALVRSAEIGDALAAAVDPHNGTRLTVKVGELKAIGTGLASQGNPDVLIVDVNVEDADDIACLKDLTQRANGLQVPVVLTAGAIAPMALRRLLRDGIDDFFPQPFSAVEVSEALRTALSRHGGTKRSRSERPAGCVMSFVRASGGMGATTLAINIAYLLTQREQPNAPQVCLLDLDPQFGNAALYLDLAQGNGLIDIVRTPTRLDGDLLRGAMLRHRSGLHVLTAPNISMPLDALQPEVVQKMIEVAAREFDYVIVDLPRALTRWTEVVLVQSAVVALVVQLTVPALRQARRLIDMLQEEGHYALPLSLILNRYARKWNDLLGVREAEKALGRKVDHVIANDFALISAALNEGLPATAVNRRSKFCRNIEEMAEILLAKTSAPEALALAP